MRKAMSCSKRSGAFMPLYYVPTGPEDERAGHNPTGTPPGVVDF